MLSLNAINNEHDYLQKTQNPKGKKHTRDTMVTCNG